jgi:hypothetical protein
MPKHIFLGQPVEEPSPMPADAFVTSDDIYSYLIGGKSHTALKETIS